MSEEESVLATLEEYANAYCSKDIERLMEIFVDSDDISVIGTGADELCSGQDEVRSLFTRNFTEATAKEFKWHWQHVAICGDCAVVATTLTICLETEDGPLDIQIRWTVSLIKRTDQWYWLHRHASAAAITQGEGAAYPTAIKMEDT